MVLLLLLCIRGKEREWTMDQCPGSIKCLSFLPLDSLTFICFYVKHNVQHMCCIIPCWLPRQGQLTFDIDNKLLSHELELTTPSKIYYIIVHAFYSSSYSSFSFIRHPWLFGFMHLSVNWGKPKESLGVRIPSINKWGRAVNIQGSQQTWKENPTHNSP